MKIKTLIIASGSCLVLLASTPLYADKSGQSAKHKDKAVQMRQTGASAEEALQDRIEDARTRTVESYRKPDGDDDDDRDKSKNKDKSKIKDKSKSKDKHERDDDEHEADEARGLEKQREMKAELERFKEGAGSEQGQEMREEHSRKWWQFWGE